MSSVAIGCLPLVLSINNNHSGADCTKNGHVLNVFIVLIPMRPQGALGREFSKGRELGAKLGLLTPRALIFKLDAQRLTP